MTVLLPAAPAFAGPANSASITVTSAPSSADPPPALDSTVWYAASYPSGTKNPVVDTECYQGGTLVFGQVDTVSSVKQYGVLLAPNPSVTPGVAADCTASLQSRVFKGTGEVVVTLARTTFTAEP